MLGTAAFIIAPIVVMYYLQDPLVRLRIVVTLLSVFILMLAFLTNMRDWEILGATAAWVFLIPFENLPLTDIAQVCCGSGCFLSARLDTVANRPDIAVKQ